jgi:hypothetical protein
MSLRSLVKAAVRPLIHPIWRRMWLRVELRLQPIEARVGQLERDCNDLRTKWNQHVPVFLATTTMLARYSVELTALQTLASQLERDLNKVAQEQSKLTALQTLAPQLERDLNKVAQEQNKLWARLWRLDLIRHETMLEMHYGPRPDMHKQEKPIIVNKEKIERARAEGARLNLGCGHILLDGYINIDARNLPGIDVVTDVATLPFEFGTVREIFSAHFLDHFPQEELVRKLLPYWRRLLAAGGMFRAIVPDGGKMISELANGRYTFSDFREVLFGGQEYDGKFHFNLFTPGSLGALLTDAGFEDVTCVEKGLGNGKCYEFEVTAMKPPSEQEIVAYEDGLK